MVAQLEVALVVARKLVSGALAVGVLVVENSARVEAGASLRVDSLGVTFVSKAYRALIENVQSIVEAGVALAFFLGGRDSEEGAESEDGEDEFVHCACIKKM